MFCVKLGGVFDKKFLPTLRGKIYFLISTFAINYCYFQSFLIRGLTPYVSILLLFKKGHRPSLKIHPTGDQQLVPLTLQLVCRSAWCHAVFSTLFCNIISITLKRILSFPIFLNKKILDDWQKFEN